jgi:hypothetical protein
MYGCLRSGMGSGPWQLGWNAGCSAGSMPWASLRT